MLIEKIMCFQYSILINHMELNIRSYVLKNKQQNSIKTTLDNITYLIGTGVLQ